MCEDEKLTGFVKNVADAIREVEGSSDQIRPVDFPERIKNLSSSSSSGFVYNVNTVNETSVPTADLEKLKSDPNAMIIETYTIAPVNFKIYYRKMFKSGNTYDRFVSVYSTANEEHINQTTLRAYRDLNYATSTLSKKRTVNIVNEDQLAGYLRRPTDNPTKDSLVAVSSNGGISWKSVGDFLAKDSTETPYDQIYFKNGDGSNIMRNVRSGPDEYVMPIYIGKGQLKTNAPEVALDCVNKQYLEDNYNGNPALDGTEAELTSVMLKGVKYKVPSGGFVYKVTTSAELTIATEDLAKIKADDNAIIVEVDSTRLSVETRIYRKGIDFLGNTVFVAIYTTASIETMEGGTIAYRGLNTTTGVLSARHVTDAASLTEVRNAVKDKLIKPSGNPTEDSLVKVSSAGTSSWQPKSELAQRYQDNALIAHNNEFNFITKEGTIPQGYAWINYRAADGTRTTPIKRYYLSTGTADSQHAALGVADAEESVDAVNLRTLRTKYNANPTLAGTETELTSVTIDGTKYKVPSGGGSGAGIDTLTDVDLTASGTTVAYDIASGVTVNSNGKFTYEGGEKEATTKVNIPIVAGKGIVINKVADKEQVEAKVNINEAATSDVGNSNIVITNNNNPNIKGNYGVLIGGFSIGDYSVAIGNSSNAGEKYAVAIGPFSFCSAEGAVAIGVSAFAETNRGAIAIGNTVSTKNATIIGKYGESTSTGDLFVLADGTAIVKHNYFKITKETVDNVTKYTAYLNDKKLLTEDEGLSKPSGNPTEDSVVKVSSTGTVSYLGIDTTATSASANLVTSGAVAAVEYSLSQSIAGCATEPDISTFPENDDAFFIGEKTSHASKWLPKKQMTLKSHKIHFDAFDSGSSIGQFDDAFISVLCYTETHFTVDTLTVFMLATGQSYPVCSPSYGMVGYVRVSNAAGEITWEDKEGNNIALAGINESSYVVTDIQSFFPFE